MSRYSNPFPQYLTNSGKVVPEGKLFFFQNGNETPLATFSDASLETENTNPVLLDSAGRITGDIFMSEVLYRVRLTDANEVQIEQADAVSGISASTSAVLAELTVNGAFTVAAAGAAISLGGGSSQTLEGAWSVTGEISGTSLVLSGNISAAVGNFSDLQVDSININGDTISSIGGPLNITPAAGGHSIVLDGTISIDAGVVTGATSITSTVFIGALTGNASTAATAGTVTDAAQTAITSVGTLTSLTVAANLVVTNGAIDGGTNTDLIMTADGTGQTKLGTAGGIGIAVDTSGDVFIPSLSGAGTRAVMANNFGELSAP